MKTWTRSPGGFVRAHAPVVQARASQEPFSPETPMKLEDVMIAGMTKMGYSGSDIEARIKELRQRPDSVMLDKIVSAEEAEKLMGLAAGLRAPYAESRSVDPKEALAASNHAAQQLRASLGGVLRREESMSAREFYFKIGFPMWEDTYALKPDASPEGFIQLAANRFERIHAHDPRLLEQAMLMLSTEEGQNLFLQSTTWVNCAMPVVQLAGHKYAAALAATAVPCGIEIKPPWPAFLLELPIGLFSTEEGGSSHQITHAMVHVVDKKHVKAKQCDIWNFSLFSPDMVNLRRWSWTLDDLRDNDVADDIVESVGAFAVKIDDADQRTLALATRVILNTCLFMSDPNEVKPLGKNHGSSKRPARDSKGPICRVYRVGKPIDLDVRPAVAEYLAGKRKGSSPTVQHLRRGHFTHQPYGPGNSLRRVQWRQPCWVGPEEALINVRPHVMPSADARMQ